MSERSKLASGIEAKVSNEFFFTRKTATNIKNKIKIFLLKKKIIIIRKQYLFSPEYLMRLRKRIWSVTIDNKRKLRHCFQRAIKAKKN